MRFRRLRGRNVLCLPVTDHALIAVQTILEKQILAEGGSKDYLGHHSHSTETCRARKSRANSPSTRLRGQATS